MRTSHFEMDRTTSTQGIQAAGYGVGADDFQFLPSRAILYCMGFGLLEMIKYTCLKTHERKEDNHQTCLDKGCGDSRRKKMSYRTEPMVWGAPLPSVGLNKSDL